MMARRSVVCIQVGRHQGLANQMFRYAYARHLQALIPGSTVTGYDLPPFGLYADEVPLDGRVLHIPHGHRHPLQTIASLVNRGVYDHVQLDGYVQRLEFYPDRDGFGTLFPPLPAADLTFLGADHVVVNVRAAEVLGNIHPDYGPVPVAYFQQVAESTGLKPVVMGQLGDDFYSDRIRQCFQGCTFLPSRSPAEDFQILRQAVHVVIGVSTFSWLACWMSNTAKTIHMPLKGLFNPLQRPDVDLLPVGDLRYRFYAHAVERWEARADQKERLVSPQADIQPLTHDEVRRMMTYTFS
jgi:hypothetical protein